MAHFVKIENGVVVDGTTLDDSVLLGDDGVQLEAKGSSFLADLFAGEWVQTSYNTYGGVHYDPETGEPSEDQTKALRFNYAGIGYTYDEERDAFVPPKPFESWVLNEETCLWEAPLPYPEDGGSYSWSEDLFAWELISE